jgi:uncharacterized RDD family membrane protein YckC
VPIDRSDDVSGPLAGTRADAGTSRVEPLDLPRAFVPAGVAARFAAGLLDVGMVVALLRAVPQPFPPLLVLLVFVGYHWLLTWWVGRTLGKALLGLRVLRLSGPMSWWWALGRSAPGYLVLAVAGLGWLTATRDAYRRPLYDILLGGVVIQDVDATGKADGLVDRLLAYAREHQQAISERKEPLALVAGLWASLNKGPEWVAKGLQLLRGETAAVNSGTSLSSWVSGQMAAAISVTASVAAAAAVTVVPGLDVVGQWLMTDRYWSPQPASIQQFAVDIGDRIEPGRPAPGAGELSVAGEQDHFLFVGRAGQQVVIEVVSLGGEDDRCGKWDVSFRLLSPGGDELSDDWVGNSGCRVYGAYDLPVAGSYTLAVQGGTGSVIAPTTGNYQFRLLDRIPQETS